VSARLSEGALELSLVVAPDGRTRLARRAQRFPLRLTVPLYLDAGDPSMAFLYVQNPTGGVFAGDDLQVRVDAGPGTRTHLTTTAATKVYRMPSGHAEACIEITLGDGAYLELVPEPLVPQAGSSLSQQLTVRLAPDAGFVATELVAPGRLARGEVFEYRQLTLRTGLFAACGRELCQDILRFEPSVLPPTRRGLLGDRPYLATVIVGAPSRDAEALAAVLDDAVRGHPEVFAAAGALPNSTGALARILARTATAARSGADAAWAAARHALLDLPLPPRRK
jgi:urease accessory protein